MKNAMGWNVVPDGLREMLRWISERYNNPLIYITENGSAEPEVEDSQSVVHDERRRAFLESHIGACADAINMHRVNLAGYFAWSFLDNFEWQYGYQRRFGICHVNFTTQQRTPRDSALWYRNHIQLHEHNDSIDHGNLLKGRHTHDRSHGKGRLLKMSTNREPSANRIRPTELPKKVLIGYGSDCNAVRRAVHDGVNIVVWSFIDVVRIDIATDASASNQFRTLVLENEDIQSIYSISTSLNLTDVRSLIVELYTSGYGDVLHFASVGGWNGAHIDTKISPSQWYKVFTEIVGDIFDGIDWDLEGNDILRSPYNFFTLECLNHMGMISQLAKQGTFLP
jgi:Glycosyl hydrolase family 1